MPFYERIERDGNVKNSNEDPPGQETQYILPGDLKLERHRKATFSKFPNDVAINVMKLAISGFFYTGYRDRVKCFSCGIAVENWIAGDDPTDKRWHKQSCLITWSVEPRNVVDITFLLLGSGQPNWSAGSLASYPGGENNQEQQPCVTAAGAVGGQIPSNSLIGSSQCTQFFTPIYPCKSAVNPHMKTKQRRLRTFSFGWPEGRIQATSAEIAEAGFFYIGERDRTKCWYCNGGLQNWELHDDPWTEHAKWFPSCEFVLSIKGEEFVARINEANPHLKRPRISNPVPDIVTHVSRLLEPVGFTRSQVKEAREKRKRSGVKYDNAEALIDFILSPNETEKSKEVVGNGGSCETDDRVEVSDQQEKTESLKEQYRSLRRENLCKSCFRSPATFLYDPCGHLAVCEGCVGNRCILCKRKVEKKIKIYRV